MRAAPGMRSPDWRRMKVAPLEALVTLSDDRLSRGGYRTPNEHAVSAVVDSRSLRAVPVVHHAGQRDSGAAHSDVEGTDPRSQARKRIAGTAELPRAAGRGHPDGAGRGGTG